jgi:hypothetical protein
VEAQKACLPWTFGEQHVPAALEGRVSCLEIQLLACPIEAGENDNRLAGPGFGRSRLQEVAR